MSLPKEFALLENGDIFLSEADYQELFEDCEGSSNSESRCRRPSLRDYTFFPVGSLSATGEPGSPSLKRRMSNITYITTTPSGEQQRHEGMVCYERTIGPSLRSPPPSSSPDSRPSSSPRPPTASPNLPGSPSHLSFLPTYPEPHFTLDEWRALSLSPIPSPSIHIPRGRRDSSASCTSQSHTGSPRIPSSSSSYHYPTHGNPSTPIPSSPQLLPANFSRGNSGSFSILYELGLPRPDSDDASFSTADNYFANSPSQ
ncbi:hypothetical protein J3R30DRAFT_3681749 [Lentinula aciculospora]|uniref:Uncharacterized protein n=1 Tax=Lentinula aciculospora TaxID=153920 RepID=A0A9W9AHA3_9AGAR|nr:hypothetical protein J3R30DRAFT_3681749 [Lentinula aciculospora]